MLANASGQNGNAGSGLAVPTASILTLPSPLPASPTWVPKIGVNYSLSQYKGGAFSASGSAGTASVSGVSPASAAGTWSLFYNNNQWIVTENGVATSGPYVVNKPLLAGTGAESFLSSPDPTGLGTWGEVLGVIGLITVIIIIVLVAVHSRKS